MIQVLRPKAAVRVRALAAVVVSCALSCGEPEVAPSAAVASRAAALTSGVTLNATGDTYLKQGSPNQNQGGDTVVRLQQSGKNRGLLLFDVAAIRQAVGSGSLVSASLELTIDTNSNNWGTTGRAIALHRLKQASAEYSATWSCAIDASIANSTADCSGANAWNMDSTDPNVQPWLSPASATATITNNQSGVVSFNVSADVAAILANTWPGYGFLLKKVDETVAGSVDFKSRERGVPARLVLQVQGATAGSGGGGPVDAGTQHAALVTNADSHVRQGSPNQNYGTADYLRIQASGRNRAIVNFDPNAVHTALGSNHLVHASLELTITQTFSNWGPDRAVGAHRLRQNWSELGATWNCSVDSDPTNGNADCGGANTWFMWRPDLPASQEAWVDPPTGTSLVMSGQTGVVSFDVTKDVGCYLAGYLPFSGFLVKKEMENQSGHVEFASRETATPPRLVLDFTAGAGATFTQAQCTGVLPDGGTIDAGMDAGSTCTPSAATDVTCNNIDDDCDGHKDEDYDVTATSCGQGACAATGERSCVNGVEQNSCVAGTPGASDSNCDGVDQDCDGRTDEAFLAVATQCGVGACVRAGSTSCVSGAVFDSCAAGSPAASDVTCDGIDDNCNGSKDEGYLSHATGCGVGACLRAGSTNCVNGAVVDSCVAGTPGASDSSCDGVDDNCNGAADEGYVPTPTSCGTSQCMGAGQRACQAGVVVDTCVTPAGCEALCRDGLDNDTDGAKDCHDSDCSAQSACKIGGACIGNSDCSALFGTPQCLSEANLGIPHGYCTIACGAADAQGPGCPLGSSCTDNTECVPPCTLQGGCSDPSSRCIAGMGCVPKCLHDSDCSNGRYCAPDGRCTACQTTDVTCDGVDENCNGTKDEGYVSQTTSCGQGACTRSGATSCVNGAIHNSCVAGVPAASDATCDGIDDNCNGASDEGYVSLATQCGAGACLRTGSTSCVSGVVVNSCVAGTPAASDATCDGIDDNCNGVIDEAYVSSATQCGVGACARGGATSCVSGVVVNSCVAGTPAASDVTCDGVDDNCNGSKDEGFVPGCIGSAKTSCVSGAVVTTPCDDANACNGSESCGAGACQSGTTPLVDDSNACTVDACTPGGGVTHQAAPPGTRCTGNGVCIGTTCSVPKSCRDWLTAAPGVPDGIYTIDPDGSGPVAPFSVYCDMTTDGGGWQLITLAQLGRNLVGTGFCQNLSTSSPCAGQLHPSQPSVRSEVLVRDLGNGAWLRYGGFSGGAQSALRYFTRELTLTTTNNCSAANHVCADTTRDPGLRVTGTSGFALEHQLPLKQYWNGAGWLVGGDPNSDQAAGRIHASSSTSFQDIRSRASLSASSVQVGNGIQAIFHRADSCTDGVLDGNETDIDCGGSCPACNTISSHCTSAIDCASGFCGAGICAQPEKSCAVIHAMSPNSPSRAYLIDVDGDGPQAPFSVYCDMTTDGGGWQLLSSVRSDVSGPPLPLLVGTSYCTDPNPSLACKGQMHPLQPASDTELMVRVPASGDYVVYNKFSASAQSSLRYFTHELSLTTAVDCAAANHVCANSTRDPSLAIARTSGYPAVYPAQLSQWWQAGGWWVGTTESGDTGRVHKSIYNGLTDLRTRASTSVPGSLQSSGHQVLQFRSATPPTTGCFWRGQPVPIGTPCSDGTVCTTGDVCDASGACHGTPVSIPDDHDPCTADACDPVRGITHDPVPEGTSCSDGKVCNGQELCTIASGVPQNHVQVNPREIYLTTSSTSALLPHPIRLADYGVAPGAKLTLRETGSYQGAFGQQTGMIAVFSSSNTVLAASAAARIPGALQSNAPAYSTTSDIAQDFLVPSSGVTVTVPAGAAYLFVTAYADDPFWNLDPDGDFGITFSLFATSVFSCKPGQALALDDGNACTIDSCNPSTGVIHDNHPELGKSCAQLGAECGLQPNGCAGTTIDCGSCPTGQACGALTPGRCGPQPLPSSAVIHIGRRVNVALTENGGKMIEPVDNNVNNAFGAVCCGGYTVADTLAAKTFTVQLMGAAPWVIDSVSFGWEGAVDHAEVWVSDQPTFDASQLVRVADQDTENTGTRNVSFAAVRARFVRIVVTRRHPVGNVAGRIYAFSAYTRAREGGIMSLYDAGAQVVRASSEVQGAPATNAFDVNDSNGWSTSGPAPQSVVLSLANPGFAVSELEIRNTQVGGGDLTPLCVKTFAVDVSTTGSADSDFSNIYSGTGSNIKTFFTYEMPATPARYARLRLLSDFGGGSFAVEHMRLYSQEFGGASVPFDDLTPLAANQVAMRVWDFGDGTLSNEQNPLHTYAQPGTYSITLTISDTQGHAGVAHATYTVIAGPSADFDYSPLVGKETHGGDPVTTLTDRSVATSGQRILTRSWTSVNAFFGFNGPGGFTELTSVTTQNPTQTVRWEQDGVYPVTLNVQDTQLLTSTVTKNLQIDNIPPVAFAGPDTSGYWGYAVGMGLSGSAESDKGNVDETTLLRCAWDFGDGLSKDLGHCDRTTDVRAVHTYQDPGTFAAKFIVSDDHTLSFDTAFITIDRHATQLVPLSMTPTAIDGDFVLSAKLFDALDPSISLAGLPVLLIHSGGSVSATTGADGIAYATIHFSAHSYSSVQYSFAGNARYKPDADQVDYIVREGDVQPVEATPASSASEGSRFVLAFPESGDYKDLGGKRLLLMLSARTNTTARVRAPAAGFDTTVPVSAGQIEFVTVPEALRMGRGLDLYVGDSGVIESKGIEVTSPDAIGVQALDQIIASTDGYLALPAERLGTDYLALGLYSEKTRYIPTSAGSQLGIVASEDGTQVTITPSANVAPSATGAPGASLPNGARSGQPFTITLNALQTFQIFAESDAAEQFEDLSGTRVTSNKPVAVYAGHICTSLSSGFSACNHMIEQMPPVSSFGTRFETVPMNYTGDRYTYPGDIIRVMAGFDGTQVQVDGALKATLNRGQIYQLREGFLGYHEIVTSQPSIVAQYERGADTFENSDPSFMVLPPVTQFVDRIVFAPPSPLNPTPLNPNGYQQSSQATLIAKTAEVGTIRIDGQPLTTGWRVIGDGTYAGARFPVAQGSHIVTATKFGVKFMVLSYGFGFYDGYAFPAGMQVAQPLCRLSKTVPGDGIDNDCDGVEGEERLNGIDDDGDGVPDEDLALERPANAPNHAPVVTATNYPHYAPGFGMKLAVSAYDDDGDALSYRLVSPPSGASISGNVISYSGTQGTPTFTVIANDGHVDSAAATLTTGNIAIFCNDPLQSSSNRCNELPYFWGGTFQSQVIKVPNAQVLAWSARAFAHDWDRHAVTYKLISGAPAGMAMDAQTGIVNWTIDPTNVGTYNITERATDVFGASVDATLQLTVVSDSTNAPPVFDSTPVATAKIDTPYSYTLLAHDPENKTLSYQFVVGPAGMLLTGNTLSWTPGAGDVGNYSVLVRVTDPSGGSAVQRFTLTVLGSSLQFVSQPALLAAVGTEYIYRPQVSSTVGQSALSFDFDGTICNAGGCGVHAAARGMQLNPDTGELRWTPAPDQLGAHEVILVVRDENGNVGKQFFNLEVLEANVAPRITSTPVMDAVVHGHYYYDVDAADLGIREVLTYQLVTPPAGMNIDIVTGAITWQPTATGSYPVKVQVVDSSGQTDTQNFVLQVAVDTTAPVIDLQITHRTIASGGDAVLTALASDESTVASFVATIDGVPVQLNTQGQFDWTSTSPGVHTIAVTATDQNGNVSHAVLTVGVEDASDTHPPVVTIDSPTTDAELTYIHDVVGTVSDANLLDYTLELRRIGDTDFREVGGGELSVSHGALGKLDTTLLEDGYYELKLSATDVNGAASSASVPFRVSGQAKVGVMQLSLVDAVVPMAGIPLTVVRSYDSRNKDTRGDFGYGWRLSVKQGSVTHNRPPGEGYSIYTSEEDFSLECQRSFEHESHFTEVRLSEREWYVFRPVIENAEGIANGCDADVAFDLVDGTTAGAQLFVVGGEEETRVHVAGQTVETGGQPRPANLGYALDPDRGVFNPQELRLELADGRKFDLTVGVGITAITDKDGNTVQFTSNGVFHSGGKSVFFTRDAQGRIASITDPMGQEIQYAYDLNGDLVRVTNPLGEAIRMSYTQSVPHQLNKVYDAAGRRVADLSYDASGRLTQSCDVEGGCAKTNYDLTSRTMTQLDATAKPVKYDYDGRGNVVTQTDGLGHAVHFQYDADDNLTRAQGPDGSVATYTYDGSKNMLTRELPHEATESAPDFTYTYTYTAQNKRSTVTLPSGGVIRYDYDAVGNQTAVKDGAGNVIESRTYNTDGTLATRTDRFGMTQYTAYDHGQPTQMTDPFGETIVHTYDANGKLLTRAERGLTTKYAYDTAGKKTSVDHGNGSTIAYEYTTGAPDWTAISGPTFGRVERSFTAKGNLGGWTEPNGDTFTRLYDSAGRVSEEIDALGNSTVYAYDAAGRLSGITDATLNAATTFERDGAGRVTKTTDALGHETHTNYKLGGRLESTTNARGKTTSFDRTPTSASITDALSRTTVTSLSTYGLPGSTQYPGGAATSSSYLGTTRLDGAQQFPTSFEDELERSRDYGYDAKSGLTSATDLAGESWSYQYTPAAGSAISYDVFSGSVSTANADGGASAYQSSGGGTEYRDVSTTGGGDGGNFTHLLSQVTSPKGETTKFERGANGRINKVTYPDTGTRTIAYGADQRPETITLPQGTVVTLDHDAFGREISRTTNTGEHRELTYGPGDRIETMTDNTGTTTYSYDAAGRFSGITYPSGASVKYTRDKLDRTTDVRVKPTATAAEIVTHYTYDPNGNLAEITDPNNGVTGFTYDDADRLAQRVLPNGVVTSYGYDSRDRVLSVVHRNANNAVLASVVYERSPSGEPTKITREDGTYTKVEYDSALRVKKEQQFDANNVLLSETQYGYDLDGNRTSKTTLTGQETYSYSAGFKLSGITGTDGNEVYAHDAGGRLIGIDRAGVHRTVEYDSMDHITRITDGGIEVERYTFDGMGRRVAVNNGASTKKFLIAPNMGDGYESPQAVTDAGGNVIATFVYAGEHPIAKITPSGVEYFLGDAMGSVIGKANTGGASTASIKYTAFGEVTSAVGASAGIDFAVGAEPRFQGMTLDSGTGLYFVRARSYDARTGRFVSRDALAGRPERVESYHPYVFADSNPFIFVDPSGRASLMDVMTGVAIAGILAVTAESTYSYALNFIRGFKHASDAAQSPLGGLILAGDALTSAADIASFGFGPVLRDIYLGDSVDVNEEGSAYAFAQVIAGVSVLKGAAQGAVEGVRFAYGNLRIQTILGDGERQVLKDVFDNAASRSAIGAASRFKLAVFYLRESQRIPAGFAQRAFNVQRAKFLLGLGESPGNNVVEFATRTGLPMFRR